MRAFIDKVKAKWHIKSDYDFWMINLTFSLAGMFVVFVRKPMFHLLHITHQTPLWVKVPTYLLIFFPTYQINLLIIGFLLGQFDFFLDKQKKLIRFLSGKSRARQPISPLS